jgi:hypothetical protein
VNFVGPLDIVHHGCKSCTFSAVDRNSGQQTVIEDGNVFAVLA